MAFSECSFFLWFLPFSQRLSFFLTLLSTCRKQSLLCIQPNQHLTDWSNQHLSVWTTQTNSDRSKVGDTGKLCWSLQTEQQLRSVLVCYVFSNKPILFPNKNSNTITNLAIIRLQILGSSDYKSRNHPFLRPLWELLWERWQSCEGEIADEMYHVCNDLLQLLRLVWKTCPSIVLHKS
jgi:hypothetical protein